MTIAVLPAVALLMFTSCSLKGPHSKPAPVSQNVAKVQPRTLGEVFYVTLADSKADISELLDQCALIGCTSEIERQQATKLRQLHLALKRQDGPEAQMLALGVIDDFRILFENYLPTQDYAVPVLYEAWFLAGALYPHSKTVSEGLFDDVKKAKTELDNRASKPSGYYLFHAIDTEFRGTTSSEKAMAYRNCVELEPSLKRCHEGYQKYASFDNKTKAVEPTTPQHSPVAVTHKCTPEIVKLGFSLYIGDTKSAKAFPLKKSFKGKKFYHARQAFAEGAEIQKIKMDEGGESIRIDLATALQNPMEQLSKKNAKKVWLLVRHGLIFASGVVYPTNSNQISLTRIDQEGLSPYKTSCK